MIPTGGKCYQGKIMYQDKWQEHVSEDLELYNSEEYKEKSDLNGYISVWYRWAVLQDNTVTSYIIQLYKLSVVGVLCAYASACVL